ncbi:MAG: hypothetical protein P8H45_05395 [Flavobacteriaceae bacterium]|nr:hypothetical protein [Flavobacteriaceae bacterium]
MKTICLLFLFFSLSRLQAQTIDKYSLSVNGTLDVIDDYYAEGIELNLFRNKTLYSIGYYTGDEYVFFGDQPDEIYRQLNLLIGKYNDSKNQKFRFQYQAGIGLFWATLRTDEIKHEIFLGNTYFTETVRTIGVPLKIGGRYMPFSFMSIGIDIQANLNSKRSNTRPMLSVEFGNIRSKK